MGRNAIECLIYHGEGTIAAQLLLCTTDAEFLSMATPYVWGGLMLPVDSWDFDDREDGDFPRTEFQSWPRPSRILVRLVELVPRNLWPSLISNFVHMNLRLNAGNVTFLFDSHRGPNYAELRELALQALLEPFDSFYWSMKYSHVGDVFHRPTPHAMAEQLDNTLIKLVMVKMEEKIGKQQFDSWLATRDGKGAVAVFWGPPSLKLRSPGHQLTNNQSILLKIRHGSSSFNSIRIVFITLQVKLSWLNSWFQKFLNKLPVLFNWEPISMLKGSNVIIVVITSTSLSLVIR